MDALIGACALNVWETLPTPPFYNIRAETPADERTEQLSIRTQFFLANLNVYCKARGISERNFGVILDESPDLSHDLVRLVSEALTSGEDVEEAICHFCTANGAVFGLSRALYAEDLSAIRQTFERTYRTVTATKENPHMDEFMMLDRDATGKWAKCVTHQGAICVNFAEIMDPTAEFDNPEYFASIRADFAIHPSEVPHKNESVASDVEIDVETLLARINEEQFERLPAALKEAIRAHPSFQLRQFLDHVAKGRQEEAEALLTANPDNTQILLSTPGVFTDYSGRTFNSTAYENAWWGKDTPMCRMLVGHMDDKTKAIIAARIDEIERIDAVTGQAVGLVYRQGDQEYRSAHFDFRPLEEAYQCYLDGFAGWIERENLAAIYAAWLVVGKAQRNVPAHVAQEYCRPDRSFYPRPEFNEAILPRRLTFYNYRANRDDTWFPLAASNSGLGFDFSVARGGAVVGAEAPNKGGLSSAAGIDLAAVSRLAEVRTIELTQRREDLNRSALSQSMSV